MQLQLARVRTEIGGLNDDYPGDQWHMQLSSLVAHCRANGIVPMDSAYGNFNDPEGIMLLQTRGGYWVQWKWAIHPSQIPLANDVFSPRKMMLLWRAVY